MKVLVGERAPDFSAAAIVNGCEIVENFSLSQFLGKKYVVLFFYPKDFTFVCPTEMWAFQERLPDFEKRNVELMGCSTDSEFAHFAWLEIPRERGGLKGVSFPLIADINKVIAHNYGVLAGTLSEGDGGNLIAVGESVAYRGLFLIDKDGVVQHCVINNMPFGRSVEEALRMVDALQHFEKFGEVCPANWHSGQKAMLPTQDGLREFFE
ncbi:MAG: peroxiredoxin [Puniceicoccales bacterium]|jgi:peroxiredoxin (alkyl hydroperoxide reductase subunit C)|nr:peroxiredoxin [Puniceicoccales bacterium]